MRRKDREVTDPVKIREIITACDCCRLGLWDKERAYVVPMDFGFAEKDGRYAFYFHSEKEGRKIDLLRRNGWAALEMDCGHAWVTGPRACEYTARFQCVMGGGPVSLLETAEEKRAGLNAILGRMDGKDQWEMGEAALEGVCVFRLDVEELTCKVHE